MVASLLRYYRTLHNLKQKTIADLLGMSQANYSNLENGKTKLSSTTAEILAKQYGVSSNQFYTHKGFDQSSLANEIKSSSQFNDQEVNKYAPLYTIDHSENTQQFSKEEIIALTLQLKNLVNQSNRLLNWLSINDSIDQH
jgi:transcriptional regulator with XRE-family HTH domain